MEKLQKIWTAIAAVVAVLLGLSSYIGPEMFDDVRLWFASYFLRTCWPELCVLLVFAMGMAFSDRIRGRLSTEWGVFFRDAKWIKSSKNRKRFKAVASGTMILAGLTIVCTVGVDAVRIAKRRAVFFRHAFHKGFRDEMRLRALMYMSEFRYSEATTTYERLQKWFSKSFDPSSIEGRIESLRKVTRTISIQNDLIQKTEGKADKFGEYTSAVVNLCVLNPSDAGATRHLRKVGEELKRREDGFKKFYEVAKRNEKNVLIARLKGGDGVFLDGILLQALPPTEEKKWEALAGLAGAYAREVSFEDALDRWRRSTGCQVVEALLDHSKAEMDHPRVEAFVNIIRDLCEVGHLGEAEARVEEAGKARMNPSVVSYGRFLIACEREDKPKALSSLQAIASGENASDAFNHSFDAAVRYKWFNARELAKTLRGERALKQFAKLVREKLETGREYGDRLGSEDNEGARSPDEAGAVLKEMCATLSEDRGVPLEIRACAQLDDGHMARGQTELFKEILRLESWGTWERRVLKNTVRYALEENMQWDELWRVSRSFYLDVSKAQTQLSGREDIVGYCMATTLCRFPSDQETIEILLRTRGEGGLFSSVMNVLANLLESSDEDRENERRGRRAAALSGAFSRMLSEIGESEPLRAALETAISEDKRSQLPAEFVQRAEHYVMGHAKEEGRSAETPVPQKFAAYLEKNDLMKAHGMLKSGGNEAWVTAGWEALLKRAMGKKWKLSDTVMFAQGALEKGPIDADILVELLGKAGGPKARKEFATLVTLAAKYPSSYGAEIISALSEEENPLSVIGAEAYLKCLPDFIERFESSSLDEALRTIQKKTQLPALDFVKAVRAVGIDGIEKVEMFMHNRVEREQVTEGLWVWAVTVLDSRLSSSQKANCYQMAVDAKLRGSVGK